MAMPLVALPGTVCSPAVFAPTTDALRGVVEVDAVSWMTEPGPWTVPDVADGVARRIATRHGGPVVVVDRSFAVRLPPDVRAELLRYAAGVPQQAAVEVLESQRDLDLTTTLPGRRLPGRGGARRPRPGPFRRRGRGARRAAVRGDAVLGRLRPHPGLRGTRRRRRRRPGRPGPDRSWDSAQSWDSACVTSVSRAASPSSVVCWSSPRPVSTPSPSSWSSRASSRCSVPT
jgi:hypothetical protein